MACFLRKRRDTATRHSCDAIKSAGTSVNWLCRPSANASESLSPLMKLSSKQSLGL